MPRATRCREDGCKELHFGRGWCSKYYYQHSKAGDLDSPVEVVAIPQPPKPPADKKRCHALVNGSRCIRGIRAKGFCSAHWRESLDREAFSLREAPIDSKRRDYEGRESELIA